MGNVDLLKTTIINKGLSLTSVAKDLGITYVALNNKLKGKYSFTLEEALLLKKNLKLTQAEWSEIFDGE